MTFGVTPTSAWQIALTSEAVKLGKLGEAGPREGTLGARLMEVHD